MKQRLTEWDGNGDDITLGKIYTIRDAEFLDDAGDERDAVHGMWEDVGDYPVEKPTVEKRLIEWNACPSFTTLNKIYILEDGTFKDDIDHKRSIAHGVWEDVGDYPVEKHPVEKRLIEWAACPPDITLNKIYILEDGMFKDDDGYKRSIVHGVWEDIASLESTETPETTEDVVNSPNHYKFFDAEVIDVIRATLTPEEFRGYCVGNALKYRLRAGKKDDTLQDIGKAEKYEAIYEEDK